WHALQVAEAGDGKAAGLEDLQEVGPLGRLDGQAVHPDGDHLRRASGLSLEGGVPLQLVLHRSAPLSRRDSPEGADPAADAAAAAQLRVDLVDLALGPVDGVLAAGAGADAAAGAELRHDGEGQEVGALARGAPV